MKKAIALRWAAALKSGDYAQGGGVLRNSREDFCCLGVLCNLHAQDHPQIARGQLHRSLYLGHSTQLPPEVAKWARAVSFDGGDLQIGRASATDLNDIRQMPFNKIGDLVLKHWKTI